MLIEKHQQKNGKGRGRLVFLSPRPSFAEDLQKFNEEQKRKKEGFHIDERGKVVFDTKQKQDKKSSSTKKKEESSSPQTFSGFVTKAIGGSPQSVKKSDIVSSVIQLSPYGFIPAALDLGYDLNRVTHGEDGAWSDAGLDVLSMLPFISKMELKSIKPRNLGQSIGQSYNKVLQPVRTAANDVINFGRGADFVDDVDLVKDSKIVPEQKYLTFSQLDSYKKGGMMQLLKNGSGIHIKKKNRGKFTEYCGGKVTDACIRRAKASGNPTLVKRATFAANARKWKHKTGGVIKAEEGTKTNFSQKVTNFLNSDSGQGLLNFGSSVFNTIQSNKAQKKYEDELDKMKEAYINSITPEDFTDQILAEEEKMKKENPDFNSSPIVVNYKNNKLMQQALAKAKDKARSDFDFYMMQNKLNSPMSQGSNIGNILSQGLGLAGQFLSSKGTQSTSTSTPTSTSVSTPLISETPTFKIDTDYRFNKGLGIDWTSMISNAK